VGCAQRKRQQPPSQQAVALISHRTLVGSCSGRPCGPQREQATFMNERDSLQR
jgi:hypothetical protein